MPSRAIVYRERVCRAIAMPLDPMCFSSYFEVDLQMISTPAFAQSVSTSNVFCIDEDHNIEWLEQFVILTCSCLRYFDDDVHCS